MVRILILLLLCNNIALAEYEVGIFGMPEENFLQRLHQSGLKTVLIRKFELEESKRYIQNNKFSPDFIFTGGINHKVINDVDEPRLMDIIRLVKEYDISGVYVADDMKCKYKQQVKTMVSILEKEVDRLLVGELGRGFCFNDLNLDVFFYRYPAMRFTTNSKIHFKQMISKIKSHHAKSTRVYLFTQAHYQDWYNQLLNCNDEVDCVGRLYPDGQVIRLFFYFNLLSGADGQYFYNSPRLSNEYALEKQYSIEQVMYESLVLRQYLINLESVEYFEQEESIFGSELVYNDYMITAYFKDDKYSAVHPSTISTKIELRNNDKYFYDKYCWQLISDDPMISSGYPLMTINKKPELDDLCSSVKPYDRLKKIINERVKKLYGNVNPNFQVSATPSMKNNYVQLNRINEYKRDLWLKQSLTDYDGDFMNTMYWLLFKKNSMGLYRKLFMGMSSHLNYYTALKNHSEIE